MIAQGSSWCRGFSLRRGLSLVEMVISIVLVGIGLVAALNAVGASKLGQFKVSVGREGHLLAQDLMTEILLQPYADPVDGLDSFGLSAAEAATGDRRLFDDVDDYDGWSASPPQHKDGTDFVGLDGWERSVAAVWADPTDIQTAVVSNLGVKRITVTVKHKGLLAAELVALRTIGLPPLEACCFGDGTCADLRVEACSAHGGTAMGPDTICAMTECSSGPVVLFVSGGSFVEDPFGDSFLAPTAQEKLRIALTESWDFGVELIAASASQSEFDEAVVNADVAYVSTEIDHSELASKLMEVPIGVVNEEAQADFGFARIIRYDTADTVRVVDNTHYITSPYTPGLLTLFSSSQPVTWLSNPMALDLRLLAETVVGGGGYERSFATLESGDLLWNGATAAGRRVRLPWGDNGFDFGALNADGQTIMKRAIEWAANMEPVCGDGTCGAGEDACTCADDCGAPTMFEDPGVTCDDGLDNDCDGDVDCEDIDCLADPACITVCGDERCDASEDPCNCPEDCGDPTAWEQAGVNCADGKDNDCDGQIDCADLNCTTDPTCCTPAGGHCVMSSECCSGDCNTGKNECK